MKRKKSQTATRTTLLLLLLLVLPSFAQADRLHPISWYKQLWCERFAPQGVATKTNCETEEQIIVFEYMDNLEAAIGHALVLASQKDKLAKLVLIAEQDTYELQLDALFNVIKKYKLPLTVWILANHKSSSRESSN